MPQVCEERIEVVVGVIELVDRQCVNERNRRCDGRSVADSKVVALTTKSIKSCDHVLAVCFVSIALKLVN